MQKDAYTLILEAIDAGLYRPGDRLVESELAERFGVSRTPVREAMQRLETQAMLARDGRSLIVASLDHNQLADFDLREWKRAVEQNLPLGDATVFEAPGETANENRRQLGVMISWRENEGSSDTDFTSALSNIATAGGSGATVSCPTDRTCHLQYIPVIGRCSPYWHGAAVQYFCAGPN